MEDKSFVPLVVYRGHEIIEIGTAKVELRNDGVYIIDTIFNSVEHQAIFGQQKPFCFSMRDTTKQIVLPDPQENSVRNQAGIYGAQIRDLEDREKYIDWSKVRRAWSEYRRQFVEYPHLEQTAAEAFVSAYNHNKYGDPTNG